MEIDNRYPWKVDCIAHPDSKRQTKAKQRDLAYRKARSVKAYFWQRYVYQFAVGGSTCEKCK